MEFYTWITFYDQVGCGIMMIDKNELIRLLPELIREDDTIKGAIISALSSVITIKDDIERLIEHSNRHFEEARKDRLELKIAIGSIGWRSGINLENAIMELLNEILIQENIQTINIDKEYITDKEGIIFVEKYTKDVDVIIIPINLSIWAFSLTLMVIFPL